MVGYASSDEQQTFNLHLLYNHAFILCIRTEISFHVYHRKLLIYKVKRGVNTYHHHPTKRNSAFHNQWRGFLSCLNRIETKVGHDHIEPTERTKQGYLFGDKTHEERPSNVLILLNVLALIWKRPSSMYSKPSTSSVIMSIELCGTICSIKLGSHLHLAASSWRNTITHYHRHNSPRVHNKCFPSMIL